MVVAILKTRVAREVKRMALGGSAEAAAAAAQRSDREDERDRRSRSRSSQRSTEGRLPVGKGLVGDREENEQRRGTKG